MRTKDKIWVLMAVIMTIAIIASTGCGDETSVENTQVERVTTKISTFMHGEHRFMLYYENSSSMQHDPSCPYCIRQQEIRDSIAKRTLDELIKLNQ